MNPKEVKSLLKASLEAGSGKDQELGSPFIWGPPGIGKSQVVEEVAHECDAEIRDFRLVLCDPSDLRGVPVPGQDEDGNPTCMWLAPDELPRKGKGFLFFDDFVTAPPLTQASAYQIAIRPHQLGPYRLPEGWVVVAAGNRAEDKGVFHRMSHALRSRFIHVGMETSVDDWTDWAVKSGLAPEVIGFIRWRPSLLHAFDPQRDEQTFPCPRTWEFASRVMSSVPRSILSETLDGTVGGGAAAEFMAYLKVYRDLPNIEEILGGKDIVVPRDRNDLRYALITALAVKAPIQKADRMLEYTMLYPDEFAVLGIKMFQERTGAREAMAKAPMYRKWATKYRDIIVAS